MLFAIANDVQVNRAGIRLGLLCRRFGLSGAIAEMLAVNTLRRHTRLCQTLQCGLHHGGGSTHKHFINGGHWQHAAGECHHFVFVNTTLQQCDILLLP